MNPTPRLRLVSGPTAEPLSLQDAKAFSRVDLTTDDALIVSLIRSARQRIEKDTGLAILTQTWVCVYDRWPDQPIPGMSSPWWDGVRDGPISMILGNSGVIPIPKMPFQSVTSIKIKDAYGTLTTADPSIYFTEVSDYTARIVRVLGQVWPVVVMAPSGAIEITFKAGFDDTATANVPDDILFAMRSLVKHWYDNRDMLVDGRATPVPHNYQDIIAAYRPMRIK